MFPQDGWADTGAAAVLDRAPQAQMCMACRGVMPTGSGMRGQTQGQCRASRAGISATCAPVTRAAAPSGEAGSRSGFASGRTGARAPPDRTDNHWPSSLTSPLPSAPCSGRETATGSDIWSPENAASSARPAPWPDQDQDQDAGYAPRKPIVSRINRDKIKNKARERMASCRTEKSVSCRDAYRCDA